MRCEKKPIVTPLGIDPECSYKVCKDEVMEKSNSNTQGLDERDIVGRAFSLAYRIDPARAIITHHNSAYHHNSFSRTQLFNLATNNG